MKKVIRYVLPYLLVALELVLLYVNFSVLLSNYMSYEARIRSSIVALVVALLFVGFAVGYIFYYKRIVKDLPKAYNIVLFVLSDFITLVLSCFAIYLLCIANIDAWIIGISIVSFIPILTTIISHHVIYCLSNKVKETKED